MGKLRRRLKVASDPYAIRYFMGELVHQYKTTPENYKDQVASLFLGCPNMVHRLGTPLERWENCKVEVLRLWIAKAPGTRPPHWWDHDAPGKRKKGESERKFLERHGLLLAADDT
jgi:hypothetical protein